MQLMLSESGTALRKYGACLAVHRKDGSHVEVPVEDVTEIPIAGSGITLSSDAIALAARAGLAIVFIEHL